MATFRIGDRVSFPSSPTSVRSSRYVGRITAIHEGLASVAVEGYGPGHVSAVRVQLLRHETKSAQEVFKGD